MTAVITHKRILTISTVILPCEPELEQGSHASWKFLDFFVENSRTWKVLENHFGPGKSWKLKLKVLDSAGKISLKVMHFSSGSKGDKQQ